MIRQTSLLEHLSAHGNRQPLMFHGLASGRRRSGLLKQPFGHPADFGAECKSPAPAFQTGAGLDQVFND
jgi:hypothetical protein